MLNLMLVCSSAGPTIFFWLTMLSSAILNSKSMYIKRYIFWLKDNKSCKFYPIPSKFGLWNHYHHLPDEFEFENIL